MTRRTIRISIGHHGIQHGSMEIIAHVAGHWAAHREYAVLRRTAGWEVTHIPSGRCLDTLVADLERKDAIGIARALDRRTRALGEPAVADPSEGYKHLLISTVAEYIGEGRCR